LKRKKKISLSNRWRSSKTYAKSKVNSYVLYFDRKWSRHRYKGYCEHILGVILHQLSSN